MTDPAAVVVSPPPRVVEPWTRVVGHQVVSANGRGRAFCSCGAQQDAADTPDNWRTQHLSTAWPILVPRLAGESVLEWRARLVAALEKAREAAAPEEARLMAAMEVGPGQPFPTIDEFDLTAQERVEVLEHQLAGRPFNRLDDLY